MSHLSKQGEICMKKIKMLICVYLTVAMLLGIAVVPYCFSAGVLPEKTDIAVSENESVEVYCDDPSSSHSAGRDNFAASDTYENCSEVQNGDVSYDDQDNSVNDNESPVQDSGAGFISIDRPLANSYVPGAEKESVSGLNFFTDTYGKLNHADSINTYTFSLDKRGVFRYSIHHDKYNSAVGWKVSLYQEYYINGDGGETGYRLINTINTLSSVTSDSSSELGLMKGNYRLVVTQGIVFSSDIFRISVTFVEGAKYETECNDNIFRYNEIYSDIPVRGTASNLPDRQDEDWFMFTMNSDGFVRLGFSHAEIADKLSVCWQVILYSEDMTQMYSVNSEFNVPECDSGEIGLTKGNYYIAVINRVYTDIIYTLSLKRTAADDVESERNDTMDTANIISVNSTITGNIAEQIEGIDRDFFAFTVPSSGSVMLEFTHDGIDDEDGKEGWNYSLLTEDGRIIFAGVSLWADDVSASSLIGIEAGKYYVCVDSEGLYHHPQRYYITVSFAESDEWESEMNDTFDSADILNEYYEINASLTDRRNDYDFDCYTFNIEREEDITVNFFHETFDYSREIFSFTLYDENGQCVAATSDSGGVYNISIMSDVQKTETHYSLVPGKYYIRVSTGIFFENIGYKLSYHESIKEDIV